MQKEIDDLGDEVVKELSELLIRTHRFRDVVDVVFDRAMEQGDMKIAYPSARVFEVYADVVIKVNQMLLNMKKDSKIALTIDESDGKVSLIDLIRKEQEEDED